MEELDEAPSTSSKMDQQETHELVDDIDGLVNFKLPEQLQKISPSEDFVSVRHRWNTNEEIASVLIAFDRHKEWLILPQKIRPASGSMLLYNRKVVFYRRDGYCWKKRRNGSTIREDHMKLKVQGLECIYGSYVHSAILPTFHRRCYWLLQNPNIVLIHYLNVQYPETAKPSIPSLSYELRQKDWSKEELVDQLRPMLSRAAQNTEHDIEDDQKVEKMLEEILPMLIPMQENSKPLVSRPLAPAPTVITTSPSYLASTTTSAQSSLKRSIRNMSSTTQTRVAGQAGQSETLQQIHSIHNQSRVTQLQSSQLSPHMITSHQHQTHVQIPAAHSLSHPLIQNSPLTVATAGSNIAHLNTSLTQCGGGQDIHHNLCMIQQENNINSSASCLNRAAVTSTSPRIATVGNDRAMTSFTMGVGENSSVDSKNSVFRLQQLPAASQEYPGCETSTPSNTSLTLASPYLDNDLTMNAGLARGVSPSSSSMNQYLQNESRQQTSVLQHNYVLSQQHQQIQQNAQQNHSFVQTQADLQQHIKLQQQPVLTLCLKPVNSSTSESTGFVLSLQGATIVSQKDNQLVNLSNSQGVVLVASQSHGGFVLNQILSNTEQQSSTVVNSFVSPGTAANKASPNLILSQQNSSTSSFTPVSNTTSYFTQSGNNNSAQPFIYSSPMTTTVENASHQPAQCQHDFHQWFSNICPTTGPTNAFPLKVDNDLVPVSMNDITFKDESSVAKKNKSLKENTDSLSLSNNSMAAVYNPSINSSTINSSTRLSEAHPVFTWALVKNSVQPSSSFSLQHTSPQIVLQQQPHQQEPPELTAGLSELNSSTKDMITSSTSCDTLDGSFSSLPSADLNLDDLLDVNDLDDVSDLGCMPFTSSDLSEQPINNSEMAVSERSSDMNLMNHDQSSSSMNDNTFGGVSSCMVYQQHNSQHHEQPQQRPLRISCFPSHTEPSSCPMTMFDTILQGSSSNSLAFDNMTGQTKQTNVDPELNSVIKDFSPDWAYTKTNTKILVAGPWFRENSFYSCVFDGEHIPALLLQPGLLRCFTQYHSPGYVTLQVARDGVIISNCEVFEFCDRESCDPSTAHPEWFAIDSNQLKLLLIERLDQLRQRFVNVHSLQVTNCDDMEMLERSLVKQVQTMLDKVWTDSNLYPKAGQHNLTLLHLAAGLGFAKLISFLFRWRMSNSSVALEFEVDTQSVDSHACTPLMWACALGKIDAALTLYRWNTSPLRMCNKDGLLPLTLARQKGHYNLANQIEQLERAKEQQKATEQHKESSSTHSINSDLASLTSGCGHGKEDSELKDNLVEIRIIPPAAFSKPGKPGPKLTRRFSEQVIGHQNRPLSKRNSVDLLPSGQDTDHMSLPTIGSPVGQCVRETNSEPHLPVSPDMAFVAPPAPRLLLEDEIDEPSSYSGEPSSSKMDTDEVVSVPSCSPVVDVERISSDEEVDANKEGSKHQMVTLANQIIAAIPERIKLSPSKSDDTDDATSGRARSESHSSLPSQGSPHPSSFGDDSGISTPMTDSLAFEEYRYPEFGTPASSLSPDSTCLPSPYSAYSFTLDSPPPTTAEFTEYFNAPTTYMEKDFSQLTLSDQEQRKLYEAAKVIQNAYRHYRDKQQQQQQLQHQKEIEAAVLIQSYYRRYKTYAYYKKMSHAAVLIQNQFRTYYAKRKKRGDTATCVRRESERLKKGRNQSVIIQQRFRSHYQRRSLDGKEGNGHIPGSSDATDSSPPHPETSSQYQEQTPPVDTDTDHNTIMTALSANEEENCQDKVINMKCVRSLESSSLEENTCSVTCTSQDVTRCNHRNQDITNCIHGNEAGSHSTTDVCVAVETSN